MKYILPLLVLVLFFYRPVFAIDSPQTENVEHKCFF